MEEKYLPIGTVVRLKDGRKNLMIIGFMASANETNGEMRDYMGALYPEGVLSTDMTFLFNHNQIEEIVFKGLANDEETAFKKRLVEFATHGTIDGQVPNIDGMNVQSQQLMQNQMPTQNVVQPQMFTSNSNQ